MITSQQLIEPMPELQEMVVEAGGSDLNLCFQCGQCTAICPWGRVRDHKVRHMLHLAQMGLGGFEEELWLCATCNHCKERCHRGVDIPQVIRAARSVILEGGRVEEGLRLALSSLEQHGNPFLEASEKRNQWVAEEKAPAFTPTTEFLLFTCCENSFQDHNRRVMGAVVKLLDKLQVSYGTLGSQERCCGDLAYRAGAEGLFAKTARANLDLFAARGVTHILTTSPHCMRELAAHYGGLGGDYRVRHLVEHLHDLLIGGKLEPTNRLDLTVAYHDPCYLGRHAGIYTPPRTLLAAIPGVKLVELDRHQAEALCCGGGGGRMFLDTPMAERFANTRLEAAVAAGAQVLVTACPYCLCNFDESLLNLELEGQLQILEISELLWEAVK